MIYPWHLTSKIITGHSNLNRSIYSMSEMSKRQKKTNCSAYMNREQGYFYALSRCTWCGNYSNVLLASIYMQTRSKCANCCQRIHLCALFALHVHTNYADTPVLAICLTRCGGGGTAKLINPALAHLDSSQEIARQLISVSEKARALTVGLDWSHIINVYIAACTQIRCIWKWEVVSLSVICTAHHLLEKSIACNWQRAYTLYAQWKLSGAIFKGDLILRYGDGLEIYFRRMMHVRARRENWRVCARGCFWTMCTSVFIMPSQNIVVARDTILVVPFNANECEC